MRAQAVRTMCSMKPAELAHHVGAIVSLLADPEAVVRCAAAEALGALDVTTLMQHARAIDDLLQGADANMRTATEVSLRLRGAQAVVG